MITRVRQRAIQRIRDRNAQFKERVADHLRDVAKQKSPQGGGAPASPSGSGGQPGQGADRSAGPGTVQAAGDRAGQQSGEPPAGRQNGLSAAELRAARVRLAARLGAEPAPAPATGAAAEASSGPAGGGPPPRPAADSPSAPPATTPAAPAAPAAVPPETGTESPDRSGERSSSDGSSEGTGDRNERQRRTSLMLVSGVPIELLFALVAVMLTALGLAIGLLRERGRYRDAEREALTDPLTGLSNRIAFEHQLAIDWQRATRYGRPLGMLLLDLDGFKQVNDTQGHAAGDRVLCRVADAIADSVRGGDVAARLGGDEFVVLATETPAEGLRVLAGRLRAAVDELGAGVSVGWAQREPDDESPSEVLDRADQAMYEDKARSRANGRPRVPAGSIDR